MRKSDLDKAHEKWEAAHAAHGKLAAESSALEGEVCELEDSLQKVSRIANPTAAEREKIRGTISRDERQDTILKVENAGEARYRKLDADLRKKIGVFKAKIKAMEAPIEAAAIARDTALSEYDEAIIKATPARLEELSQNARNAVNDLRSAHNNVVDAIEAAEHAVDEHEAFGLRSDRAAENRQDIAPAKLTDQHRLGIDFGAIMDTLTHSRIQWRRGPRGRFVI